MIIDYFFLSLVATITVPYPCIHVYICIHTCNIQLQLSSTTIFVVKNMNTNYVRLIGHLADNLKVVTTKRGKKVGIRVATLYKLKNPDVEGKIYGTVWHNVVAYDQNALYAESNLVKGSRVMVEGMIVYRTYFDNNQHLRYITEIKAKILFNLDR